MIPSFTHIYESPIPAATTLFLQDASNCLVVKKGPVILPSAPDAFPVADRNVVCYDEKITFRDLSTSQSYAPLVERRWEFEDGFNSYDSIVVTVVDRVSAMAGPDTSICLGDTLQLRVETDGISSGEYRYSWEPAAAFSNPNISNPVVVPTTDQVYTVTVRNGQCADAVLPVYVSVKQVPELRADTLAIMIKGGEVRLRTYSDVPVRYQWFPELYLTCYDCPDPVARPPESILYTITATADNGCKDQAATFVKVLESCVAEGIDMPNIFSPNGDGYHDVFKVRGAGIRELISLNIFSRNGEKLFESNSLNIGWDGNYNGVPVNSGVYVYYAEIVCLDGQKVIIKGNVTLVR